jgi:hypothetical protein
VDEGAPGHAGRANGYKFEKFIFDVLPELILWSTWLSIARMSFRRSRTRSVKIRRNVPHGWQAKCGGGSRSAGVTVRYRFGRDRPATQRFGGLKQGLLLDSDCERDYIPIAEKTKQKGLGKAFAMLLVIDGRPAT